MSLWSQVIWSLEKSSTINTVVEHTNVTSVPANVTWSVGSSKNWIGCGCMLNVLSYPA